MKLAENQRLPLGLTSAGFLTAQSLHFLNQIPRWVSALWSQSLWEGHSDQADLAFSHQHWGSPLLRTKNPSFFPCPLQMYRHRASALSWVSVRQAAAEILKTFSGEPARIQLPEPLLLFTFQLGFLRNSLGCKLQVGMTATRYVHLLCHWRWGGETGKWF